MVRNSADIVPDAAAYFVRTDPAGGRQAGEFFLLNLALYCENDLGQARS
jgi:hypothetical protein